MNDNPERHVSASELQSYVLGFENGRWANNPYGLLVYLLEMQQSMLASTRFLNIDDLVVNALAEKASLQEEMQRIEEETMRIEQEYAEQRSAYAGFETNLVALQNHVFGLTKTIGDLISEARKVHDGKWQK